MKEDGDGNIDWDDVPRECVTIDADGNITVFWNEIYYLRSFTAAGENGDENGEPVLWYVIPLCASGNPKPVGYVQAGSDGTVKPFGTVVYTQHLAEDEEAPVLLKNNPLAESVEGVLSSYGLPAKHDIDPTAIMYWFYVIFFGLMLSDAAYGLIMTVACAAVLIAFPRMGRGMRKSMKMFLACGISTAVWGVLFGGFFGDLITVISTTFFGHPVSFPALWFVPLNDPMRMLIYSLLFGIIHLYFGLVPARPADTGLCGRRAFLVPVRFGTDPDAGLE